jgi:membrane protein implicated in regulation of membrane protease activity
MSRVSQWNWSDFTQEWSQTAAINELDEELAAERQARRNQARQLERTKSEFDKGLKAVDSKVDSVSERIEAVLDWTELRFQQVEFDEYQARKEIRKTVRALAGGRPARVPHLEDVPGFWLPPAAAAVLPLVLRDRPAIPAQRTVANPFADLAAGLEAARERDAVRAELFNLAMGRCFDQQVLIDAAVLRLLTEPCDLGVTEPGSVARGWRTLWGHAALGAFGPGAAAQLESLLHERFDPQAPLDDEELAAWDAAIAGFGSTEDHRPTRAEAFAALEAHLADPGIEAQVDDEYWRIYLQELIEEPSPAELPLVQEMESLGLDGEGPQYSRPTWAEPVGTVVALLRRDLFDPETPAAQRRLALDLAAPLLRARLGHLEASLGATEKITRIVRRRSASIEVTSEGHDEQQFAELERRIGLDYPMDGPSKAATTGFAVGLGAVALLFLVFGQWVVAILFALLVIIPLYVYRNGQNQAGQQSARREEQLAKLRAELVSAREDVEREEREADERRLATLGALERLKDSLPADPGPTGGLL